MDLTGKKLGILVSVAPERDGFAHAVGMADAAIRRGVDVYLYCIDDAVKGVDDPRVAELREQGVKLHACAYAARQRNLKLSENAIYSGLSVVSEIMANTDKFVSFNS